MEYTVKKVHLGPAHFALDLSDGSERGEYVNQDYILRTLGRPHRNINLMYTYYPHDKEWPARISKAYADKEVNFAWDYPYDDYFPYDKKTGNPNPIECMKDVRRHGQDVTLTLTIDCSLSDEELREVARDLRPFGRMRVRINHECVGDWFTHNKRFSFKEIAEFFARFTDIIHEEAPNVKTIFCAGFSEEDGAPVDKEEDLIAGYRAADVWSGDRYLALHFGWPYDIAEKDDNGRHCYYKLDEVYNKFRYTYERLKKITGQDKPVVMSELNADGDVTGALHQGDAIKRFLYMIRDDKPTWFTAATMYQFRDRGRLGLEIEDPNNPAVGIPQPLLKDYKEVMSEPYFMPELKVEEDQEFPVRLRWGGAEDSDGVSIQLHFESNPEFCELVFEQDLSLMMELNGTWFYKAPGVKCVDLMSAFYEKPLSCSADLSLNIFATPPEGVNVDDGSEDWAVNYYATITKLPDIRIRFEPVSVIE